jgi:uncharacterized protein
MRSTREMYVDQLWRYPVKSLRGEQLDRAELTADGIAGDRQVHVREHGHVLTGRTRHGLLTVPATTDQGGRVLVDGHDWESEEAARVIREAAGPDAELARHDGPERFDVLPLLVATDGGIAALGHDGRRLRPNLVIGGVDGLAEREWEGLALRIGDVVIGVESLRARCIVTTIDPDTGAQDLDVLRRIHRVFGTKFALDCWVAHPGSVAVGDPVELVALDLPRPALGGWILGAPYLVS